MAGHTPLTQKPLELAALGSRLRVVFQRVRAEWVLVTLLMGSLATHVFFIVYFGDIDFEPDSYLHFIYSLSAFADLPRSLNHAVGVWPKPLFTLITGLIVWVSGIRKLWIIKVFNSLVWAGAGLLVYDVALRLKLSKGAAAVGFFLTQFSFLAFRSSIGTLTEPLFTLLLLSAVSALYAKRYTASCMLVSLSTLARSEGLVMICGWVVILWVVCKRRSIYDLCLLGFFPLLWNIWGYAVSGNPTFIVSTGYPIASTTFGHGGWFYYPVALLEYEPVIFPLMLAGGLVTINRREYLPIHVVMLVYFGFNIVAWRFGLFGTAGLLRYFVPIVPLMAVYAVSALQVRNLLTAMKRLTLVGLSPLLWQILFTVAVLNSHTAGYHLYNTPTVHHGLVEAGAWVRENYPDEYLYTPHPAMLYYADRDFYSGSRAAYPEHLRRDGLVAFEKGFGSPKMKEYLTHFELLNTLGNYVFIYNHQVTPATARPHITFGTEDVRPYLWQGWSDPEGWGMWGMGPHSEFVLYFRNPVTSTITVSAIPQFVDGRQQSVDVYYNDVPVASYTFPNGVQGVQQFSFDVPRSLMSGGLDLIKFVYGYAISPYELGISNDGRELAVGFLEMTIVSK
jgi:hypothetical protein